MGIQSSPGRHDWCSNTQSVVDVLTLLLTTGGIPLERLAVHFHDTRVLRWPNVLVHYKWASVSSIPRQGGLGGCPYAPGAAGNLATEDLLICYMVWEFRLGSDLEKVVAATRFIVPLIGHAPTSKYYQAACAAVSNSVD